MIQIVSGTRTANRLGDVADVLSKKQQPYFTIIGCASGVDAEAREFCQANGWPFVVVYALWDFEGKPAGPKRNQRMCHLAAILSSGCGHGVEMDAFPWGASRGTASAIRYARDEGFLVHVHRRRRPLTLDP
jgi:hypothetical protein